MLISAFAAIALFVAPEATQSGEAAKAAQPEMRKVCVTYEVSGSNLKRKKCRNEPVKAATKPGEGAAEPADKGQTKPE
ncbi:MAG: hypothetical protein JNK30_18055 [Phenylobacterium sp.]|uniref:hypothetical protein n=1 Tax=Phenylobacterium sp. TaxID=1871053 RepID=UPI001A5B088D|nr:hypothetical protein [Phenylobacterium sp.]MBL8773292.1 hypothetical protein [Phenylobacterium sp.]